MKLINKVKLREEYFNGYINLQYKHKDNKDNYVLLVLLSIYFMEYLSNGVSYQIGSNSLFITKIQNIENSKVVLKAVDDAIMGKGKLVKYVADFKETNQITLSYLASIIPQKEPNIKAYKDLEYIEEMKDRTDLIETNNKISLHINSTTLRKTKKQWNTQRDRKVRKTIFHQGIDRQVVDIHNQFKVGSAKALYPADSSLPPYERFNCRCYLTYY
jgi:hypothetical protein